VLGFENGYVLHKSWYDHDHYHPLLFDASGANLIHQLYSNEKYYLGRQLVEKFPEFALLGHTDRNPFIVDKQPLNKELMPYTGPCVLEAPARYH
jgi:hypothetical protein